MEQVIDAFSMAALTIGGVFYMIGLTGLVRMPDLFTRIHAVSVAETLGAGLMIAGMILQAGFSLVTLKLVFILVALWTAGAVATHALARAALHDGAKPLLTNLDGSLEARDCAQVFPELRDRLAQPLVSETVEDPDAPQPQTASPGEDAPSNR